MLEAPILPSMKSVATFLLEVQGDVRRNLKTAAHGWVETSMARIEARIANVLAGTRVGFDPASRAGGVSASIASVDTGASLASGDTGGASVVSVDTGRSGRESERPGDAPDRRFIRVSTERLDALM